MHDGCQETTNLSGTQGHTPSAKIDQVLRQDESVAPTEHVGQLDYADLCARFFRALGDPTRIRILQALVDAAAGEATVGELVARLGTSQSRTSTHLGCLRWCGLVTGRRVGKQVYYRVADARVRELLGLADHIIVDHAAGVATCGLVDAPAR